jgi:nucleoside phosphorylase
LFLSSLNLHRTFHMVRREPQATSECPKRLRDVTYLPSMSKRQRRGSQANDEPADHSSKQRLEGHSEILSHNDYTIGWVCALYIEMAAAQAMLDDFHEPLPKSPNDSNTYILGRIGPHNVVIACLPTDGYGNNNAVTVACNMFRSFSSIRSCFLVGIGGGVPGKVDVRLGDVVVSTEVVQFDLGKTVAGGHFHRTGKARIPPVALMTAVSKIQSMQESQSSKIPSILADMLQRYPNMTKYTLHGLFEDWLFDGDYDHEDPTKSCIYCDASRRQNRPPRLNRNPHIHYGVIASGNQVMKHGKTRDQLGQELDIICFEMEAAGVMDILPCLVIRGICDYSDSHKNKEWQEYAAATSAAYAKELLLVTEANEMPRRPIVLTSPVPGMY